MAISLDIIRQRISNLKRDCETVGDDNGLSLAHFTSIFDVPVAHWNPLVKQSGNFLLSAPYLGALEQHPYRGMCFHYIIAYQQDRSLAIFYFQETDVHITQVEKNVDTEKAGSSRSIFDKAKGIIASGLDSIKVRMLVSGNLLQSGQHGASFSDELTDDERAALLDSAWRKVVVSGRSGKRVRATLIKDVSHGLKNALHVLDSELTPFSVQPNMVSTVREHWNGLEDVLADFSSKYRVRAKKAMKQAAHLEVRSLDEQLIQQWNDRIMELFQNVEDGADFSMVSIHPRYFIDLKVALGDDFVLKGYFDGEDLIGFYSYIRGMGKNYASFVGLDYDHNRKCSLYQNILYRLLEDSITDGAESIDLSRTAMAIKSTMGAEPVTHHLLVKHLNPITNSIVKRFIRNIRSAEWIQRKPFKDS